MPTVLEINTDSRPTSNQGMPRKRMGFLQWLATRFVARHHANKIIRSLHEAKEIRSGKRARVTFDEFLEEL